MRNPNERLSTKPLLDYLWKRSSVRKRLHHEVKGSQPMMRYSYWTLLTESVILPHFTGQSLMR